MDLNSLVRESKDVSRFYIEAIRNIYGVYIDELDLDAFDGTVQNILYTTLGPLGLTESDVNAKLEQFVIELPYSYYNVAGHNSIKVSDGGREVLEHFGKSNEFVLGLATPVLERMAQNMFERAGIDASVFKFAEYGTSDKDANAIFISAIDSARMAGIEGAESAVFVSQSPYMLKNAKFTGLKTIAVMEGNVSKFKEVKTDENIKSLKELRKSVSKVLR